MGLCDNKKFFTFCVLYIFKIIIILLLFLMHSYRFFTKYYDQIVRGNGYDLEAEIELIDQLIDRFTLHRKNIFELACGTGVVARELLKLGYNIKGLDISWHMLQKAKENIWEDRCYHWDMTNFEIDKPQDVILCNYNSICHLIEWEDWLKMFRCSYNALRKGGLLIFDINTIQEFENITRDFASFYKIEDDVVCLEMEKKNFKDIWVDIWDEKYLEKKDFSFYRWLIKMFVKTWEKQYELVEEVVDENSFEIEKIKKALKDTWFEVLHLEDFHKWVVDKDSERVYFVAKKR